MRHSALQAGCMRATLLSSALFHGNAPRPNGYAVPVDYGCKPASGGLATITGREVGAASVARSLFGCSGALQAGPMGSPQVRRTHNTFTRPVSDASWPEWC